MSHDPDYHTIESASAEPVLVTVFWYVDPTGSTPEFQVTLPDVTSPDGGSWENGSWHDTWSSKTKRVSALSPNVGDGATLDASEGSDYVLWLRAGTVVKRIPKMLRVI